MFDDEIKKLKQKLKDKEKYNKIMQYQLKKKDEEIAEQQELIHNLYGEIDYYQTRSFEALYDACDELQDKIEEKFGVSKYKEIMEWLEKIKEKY